MTKTAILGPAGTFAEFAARKYFAAHGIAGEVCFYPSITRTFSAIGKECEIGIIPIENTLDGHLQLTLDLLLQADLQIIYELLVPIQFVFVGHASQLSEITDVYVQFKSRGQCYQFLEQLPGARIIITESTGMCYQQAKKGIPGEGAIISGHTLAHDDDFPIVVERVHDGEDSVTRFVVLGQGPAPCDPRARFKTAMVILERGDEPGAVARILTELADRQIRLISITSRPKKATWEYYLFLDVEGHYPEDEPVKDAIRQISASNTVKILGSFPKAQSIY